MAFNDHKSPGEWLGGGYALASHEAKFATADAAGDVALPELTDTEADPTTGDIRKVVFALMEALFAAWSAQAVADRPEKMQVFRSISEPTPGVVRKTYTVIVDTIPTVQEVEDEA